MSSDAAAPCPFAELALPALARDLLFRALPRADAARACCGCRAWDAALSARHLWAALEFEPPSFPDRITPDVVLGACAKAGDALREVTLPNMGPTYLVTCNPFLLPALLEAHPALARIIIAPGGAALDGDQLAAALAYSPPLAELRCGFTSHERELGGEELPLLQHSAMRVQTLEVYTGGKLGTPTLPRVPLATSLRVFADAVSAQAESLEDATLYAAGAKAGEPASDAETAPLVAALSGCAELRGLRGAPFAALSVPAFEQLATALSRPRSCFTRARLSSTEFGVHGAAVVRLLLPQLELLIVQNDGRNESDVDTAVHSLAAALSSGRAPRLRELHIDVAGPAAAAVYMALHSTQLRALNVETDSTAGSSNRLTLLAACLPASLETLDFADKSDPWTWRQGRDALLAAAAALPSLARLAIRQQGANDYTNYFDAHDGDAVVWALLQPGAAPALRSLQLGGGVTKNAVLGIALALATNDSLTQLRVISSHLSGATFVALGDALQRNTTLHELCISTGEPFHKYGLQALADGLAVNEGLTSLSLTLIRSDPLDEEEEDEYYATERKLAPVIQAMERCATRARSVHVHI